MRRLIYFILFAPLVHSLACSSFLAERSGHLLMAKNYDWTTDNAIVFLNPAGLQKSSFRYHKDDISFSWVSRYSSITMNQYGIEFPNSGMNEKGLMAEVLWLSESQFPSADSRPSINELQFIQYILDRFQTVDEVLQSLRALRISPISANVHYLICDKIGDCITVEYLKGRLVTHKSDDSPGRFRALTNNPYHVANEYTYARYPFSRNSLPARSYASNIRFLRMSVLKDRKSNSMNLPTFVEKSFETLYAVAAPSTQWQNLWSPREQQLYFRTQHGNQEIAILRSSDLSFSCGKRKAFLLSSSKRGILSLRDFQNFSLQQNHQLIQKSLKESGFRISTSKVKELADFAYSLKCL